jgi:CheY-specific phosphatase CheX
VTLNISSGLAMTQLADNAIPGYPMAVNLRQKIQKSDTMVINDVNDAATQKFVEEVGNVTIAKTVREVAEQTVRRDSPPTPPPLS